MLTGRSDWMVSWSCSMMSGRSPTAATLAGRLGIEALVDACVDLGEHAGAGNEGAKVMTLVSAMALGADCIDDCDVLRAGRTADVLGHRVMAPSTLGTFLRAFTFGHVRQLDRVLGETIQRAESVRYGPARAAQPILRLGADHACWLSPWVLGMGAPSGWLSPSREAVAQMVAFRGEDEPSRLSLARHGRVEAHRTRRVL
jgi:hypothetical protein